MSHRERKFISLRFVNRYKSIFHTLTRISPPTRQFFGLAGNNGFAVGVLTTGAAATGLEVPFFV